jgi:hypothetical protein
MKICCNKKCSHKGAFQPTSNFYRKPMTKDGLTEECKSCRKVRSKKIAQKAKENYHNRFAMFIG